MMPAAIVLMSALTVSYSPAGNPPRFTNVERGFHVRAIDSHARELLAIGAAGSRTFGQLVERLAGSDVIVYVKTVDRLRGGVTGQLMFAADAGAFRFLRINLLMDGNLTDRVSALGHELQHAVEVADAPRVRDKETLAALYLHIGWTYAFGSRYESLAAREVGEKVREEMSYRK
jgi:hypothetical protein